MEVKEILKFIENKEKELSTYKETDKEIVRNLCSDKSKKIIEFNEIYAIENILNRLEQLEKENEELNLKLIEKAQEKYVEQNSVKPQDNFFDYYDERLENLKEVLNDKDTKFWLGENGINAVQNMIQELQKTKQDNFEIKETYRKTAKHLINIGQEELANYMLAQINDVPVWTVGDGRDYIPKSEIRDKIEELENSNGYAMEIDILNQLLEEE